MNLLVVGGGGREHAIIKKLRENPEVGAIYALPGNGGIAADATCVPIGAKDIPAIVDFARAHDIGFAVVAPDDPLVLGAADRLREIGIPTFGPSAKAAEIEGSKAFSKNLMRKYGIPTADYALFTDPDEATSYLAGAKYPIVVKADGLALGKGVSICADFGSAKKAVDDAMRARVFGESGACVVLEECLEGPEVSVLAFTDGKTMVPMVSSMDHKRALDGDEGLNTGGMGVIAPNPLYTPEIASRCMETIFLPTMRAMNQEGRTFQGCLYFGLMLTKDGPKVIEYNCRFGDPEAQAVLPLMTSDLLTAMRATAEGRLGEVEVAFSDRASCCVIVASGGYPGKYATGREIHVGELPENATLYCAGAKDDAGRLVTSGGRVLGVTAVADTLENAVRDAYRAVETVHFEGAYHRRDIGKRALAGG